MRLHAKLSGTSHCPYTHLITICEAMLIFNFTFIFIIQNVTAFCDLHATCFHSPIPTERGSSDYNLLYYQYPNLFLLIYHFVPPHTYCNSISINL